MYEDLAQNITLRRWSEPKLSAYHKADSHETTKLEKTSVYLGVGKVIWQVVALCVVNMVMHMRIGNFDELQNLAQRFTWKVIKIPSFRVIITHVAKQLAQAAVPNEVKLYDQVVPLANHGKEVIPPSPLSGMNADYSQSSYEEEERRSKKEVTRTLCSKSWKSSESKRQEGASSNQRARNLDPIKTL